MSWHAINDEFYETHGEKFVLLNWNGISPGNHGKQETFFLTDRIAHPMHDHVAASRWADMAKRFESKEEAEEFLALQNTMRPHPLTKDWFACKLRDLEEKITYRPNTKAAIIGVSDEQNTTPGPN